MEYSLLIIFYYGILHALGPDHLSAIALFSIGKKKKQALLLSMLFAIGHGITLYILALVIEYFASDSLLQYGDSISSTVILLMGLYLVWLASTNKIRIDNHHHVEDDQGHNHTHIYYENEHLHDKSMLLSLGLLMGAGGIRGMLVTLSVISHQAIGVEIVIAFILGISLVFLLFGYLIYLINARLIRSVSTLRHAVTSVGLLSIVIGLGNLTGTSLL
ncbi:MAG: cytochrome c biogenesis protein CcdA [Gammaproteobacteria bacterium]